jgi:ABC-type transport system substrate-binding protein
VVIRRGGIIPMQDYAAPITARPLHAATYSGLKNLGPLFNGLIEYNPETADFDDLRGDLAKSWALAPDGVTYTFRLHENAKWWDGKPVTADDVVFSLASMTDPDSIPILKGQPRPIAGQVKDYYESSRAIDPYTVEVKTKFPAPGFLPILAATPMVIMPKDWVLAGHIQGLHKPEDLMGSGPFKHVKFIKDVSNEYVKNDNYFKEGYPRIDGMKHFIIVERGTIIAAFKSGQILMTNGIINNLSTAEALQFQKDAGDKFNVHFGGPSAMVGVLINTRVKPYDDVRVRRAIMLAIHRQPIIQTFSVGQDDLGLPFPPGQWYGRTREEAAQTPGFRELGGKKHPEDIAAAKKLLAEAGIPEKFKVTLTARSVLEFLDVATVVADQFRQVFNWDVTLRPMESAAGQAAFLSGDYQIAVQGAGPTIPEPDGDFAALYIEGSLRHLWTGYFHPGAQELYQKQLRELDREKRKALVRQADDILLHQDNSFPGLYWGNRSWIVDKRIKNFYIHPSIYHQAKLEHIWCDPKC